MSHSDTCDWCGQSVVGKEPWVRVPVMYDGPAFTYHVRCYCRIFDEDVLRMLVMDTDDRYLGAALRKVFHAIDPKRVSGDDE